MGIIETLKGKVIVSCQAMPSEPLHRAEAMAAMIKSVLNGGAGGLRVAGARDVINAKKMTNVPVIGLTKPETIPQNWKEIVYITPSLKHVNLLIKAGADIIAFDGTSKLFFSLGLIFTGCSGIANGIRIFRNNEKEGR